MWSYGIVQVFDNYLEKNNILNKYTNRSVQNERKTTTENSDNFLCT